MAKWKESRTKKVKSESKKIIIRETERKMEREGTMRKYSKKKKKINKQMSNSCFLSRLLLLSCL